MNMSRRLLWIGICRVLFAHIVETGIFYQDMIEFEVEN